MSSPKPVRMLSCLAFTSAVLAGCFEHLDIGGLGKYGAARWVRYRPAREAQQPQEKSVLDAARDYCTIAAEGVDVMYVKSDAGCQQVAVVERVRDGSDWSAPRRVVRYWVEKGKIAGMCSETVEVFPDIQFERAVITTAQKAGTLDPVTLYDGGDLQVSMSSRRLDGCTVLVMIYDKDFSSREPLAVKVVNFCH
ncbi:hypothetical protein [Geomonas anaerohicana]|uniref:Lipoprotein n=1 Tax=Geomonas anaerohicana TaxID=2798583 RepID=A0ABS0YCI8_9BACT|nr:hypothetical protein [Geomonas anaerohicana]MBJ6750005.1 hypothetical protein [Geomonas anaerohicana]